MQKCAHITETAVTCDPPHISNICAITIIIIEV